MKEPNPRDEAELAKLREHYEALWRVPMPMGKRVDFVTVAVSPTHAEIIRNNPESLRLWARPKDGLPTVMEPLQGGETLDMVSVVLRQRMVMGKMPSKQG